MRRASVAAMLEPELTLAEVARRLRMAGRPFLNVLGSIAQFEREIMLERQKEGIAAARAKGRYQGRKPTARAKTPEIKKLAAEGVRKAEIARRLAIGERSVYRMLQEDTGAGGCHDGSAELSGRAPMALQTGRV